MEIESVEKAGSDRVAGLRELDPAELEDIEGGIIDGCIRLPPILTTILGSIVRSPDLR
jgi:hypothetical protein